MDQTPKYKTKNLTRTEHDYRPVYVNAYLLLRTMIIRKKFHIIYQKSLMGKPPPIKAAKDVYSKTSRSCKRISEA